MFRAPIWIMGLLRDGADVARMHHLQSRLDRLSTARQASRGFVAVTLERVGRSSRFEAAPRSIDPPSPSRCGRTRGPGASDSTAGPGDHDGTRRPAQSHAPGRSVSRCPRRDARGEASAGESPVDFARVRGEAFAGSSTLATRAGTRLGGPGVRRGSRRIRAEHFRKLARDCSFTHGGGHRVRDVAPEVRVEEILPRHFPGRGRDSSLVRLRWCSARRGSAGAPLSDGWRRRARSSRARAGRTARGDEPRWPCA